MDYPKLVLIEQEFPRPKVEKVSEVILEELKKLNLQERIPVGGKIGITAGSRGIQNIVSILKNTVKYIKDINREPYIIAAMGSHGNGGSKGQREVLDSLGITEQEMGAPIIYSDSSIAIGETNKHKLTAYVVDGAHKVDGILVINRVKTHTSFKGELESGLIKKMVVGLGGPKGAEQFHNYGSAFLSTMLKEIGSLLLEKLPIVGGIAIVENGFEETCLIKAIEPHNFIIAEKNILQYSKELMPSLPIEDLDLLLIKEMGKNFSGTGIDTNIIGRIRIEGEQEPKRPAVKRIGVFDLSEESHGNATGLGLADFTTEKLVNKLDREATYLNCLTSTFVVRAAIPMYFKTEKNMVDAALKSLRGVPINELRVMYIPNTLHITKLYASETLLPLLVKMDRVTVLTEPEKMKFDEQGNLKLDFH